MTKLVTTVYAARSACAIRRLAVGPLRGAKNRRVRRWGNQNSRITLSDFPGHAPRRGGSSLYRDQDGGCRRTGHRSASGACRSIEDADGQADARPDGVSRRRAIVAGSRWKIMVTKPRNGGACAAASSVTPWRTVHAQTCSCLGVRSSPCRRDGLCAAQERPPNVAESLPSGITALAPSPPNGPHRTPRLSRAGPCSTKRD